MSLETRYINQNGIGILKFEPLNKYKNIIHCFTTRLGGVSKGVYSSLNLGIKNNDKKENVLKNFEILANAINIDCKNIIYSEQTHDDKVREVTKLDIENKSSKELIKGYDALITNEEDIALMTFHADCVPVFFYDNTNKVIALAHSGWKGTTKKVVQKVIEKFINNYNSFAKNIEIVIGPSICQKCFEVTEDVYDIFAKNIENINKYSKIISPSKRNINLQAIIFDTLIYNGVKKENITVSNLCTMCNKDIFFSHRGDNKKTGTLAAVLMLKKQKNIIS